MIIGQNLKLGRQGWLFHNNGNATVRAGHLQPAVIQILCIRFEISRIEALDKAVSGTAAGLKIYLRDQDPIPHICEMISKEKPGRGKVKLVVDTDHEEVEVALARTYTISPNFRAAIKSLPGIVDARDI